MHPPLVNISMVIFIIGSYIDLLTYSPVSLVALFLECQVLWLFSPSSEYNFLLEVHPFLVLSVKA